MNTVEDTKDPDYSKNTACVYYDGHCPVCSKEINAIQTQAIDLDFQDIHSLSNMSIKEKHKYLKQLYLIKSDGSILIGLDANIEMWKRGNVKWLAFVFSLWPMKFIAGRVYQYWAKKRYEIRYINNEKINTRDRNN